MSGTQDLDFILLPIDCVWSVVGGGRRLIPCVLLYLPPSPLAQLAFAINDTPMRPPLAPVTFGVSLTYLDGSSVFG